MHLINTYVAEVGPNLDKKVADHVENNITQPSARAVVDSNFGKPIH